MFGCWLVCVECCLGLGAYCLAVLIDVALVPGSADSWGAGAMSLKWMPLLFELRGCTGNWMSPRPVYPIVDQVVALLLMLHPPVYVHLVDFILAFWRNAAPGIGGFHSCLHADLNYVGVEWLARLIVSLTAA
ncbi:hypothetical protein Nepgr_008094 [Nepenthes gracilis]|uniref:Uncharacterized protein n=1 Tax=Nepenthes gracilis TaxID=150966 RepID=A0AAD3XIY4_NEPGR|nr:hypothetical protein Nepgr_008094 [Nepenthes gracilis]